MENYNLDHDIPVMFITASSFPEGICEAHDQLHLRVPFSDERHFFGISRPEGGFHNIIYKAAAQQLYENEARECGLESQVIPKGMYLSIYITDYARDEGQIGKAFEQLLNNLSVLDPNGYCIEMYIGKNDVRCMIRLNAKNGELKM
nr:transcriptional regulator [Pedobacter sp. ASV19]